MDRSGDVVLANAAAKLIWGDLIASGQERYARMTAFWHASGKLIAPTEWASARALREGRTSLNELQSRRRNAATCLASYTTGLDSCCVNLKVIKALESGNGNPGFASIEKIAEAFGLAVVFVKKDTVAEILDGEARAREKARSREADADALAAGTLSEQQLNAKNALKIGRKGF
jgi:hypothetical protein